MKTYVGPPQYSQPSNNTYYARPMQINNSVAGSIADIGTAIATAQIADAMAEQQRIERIKRHEQFLREQREKYLRALPSVEQFETENECIISSEWLDEIYVDFKEEYHRLKQLPDELRKETQKLKKQGQSRRLLITILAFVLGFIFFIVGGGYESSLLLMIGVILCVVGGVCGVFFACRSLPYDKKLNIQLDKVENEFETLLTELCAANIMWFAKEFHTSPQQVQYDLSAIFSVHPELRDNWWYKRSTSQVVETELKKRLYYINNELTKSGLQVQNLQLQNEGIAIDNSQKKFWRCSHCGNLNRADDMQCPACGGIR